MKRMLILCYLLFSLSCSLYAQTTADLLRQTIPSDPKIERELLLEKILALKAQGSEPDPMLYEQLRQFDLQHQSHTTTLDQGADNCPATVISSLPYTDNGTTADRYDDFHCANNSSPDVIYQYTAQQSGHFTISTCSGYGYDTRLEVRYGGACPGELQLDCNDDYCSLGSQLTLDLTEGTTYYIIVDGYSNNYGTYTLTVNAPPPPNGETCSSAYPLTVPGTVSGNSCEYTHNYDRTCPYSGSTSSDVVYTYTPAVNQQVTFDLCGGTTDYDTKLYVFADICDGEPVACNDDACSSPLFPSAWVSRVECVQLWAGTTYYIVVDGYGGECGPYTLTATLCGCNPPANDNCSNVTPQSLPLYTTGNNECSSHDCDFLNAGEGEVWHAFTTTYTSTVTVHVCALEGSWGVFYAVLLAGCPCSEQIFPDFSDWDENCYHGGTSMTFNNLPAGTYYYPVIYHDYNNSIGDYMIEITSSTAPPCETDFELTAPGTLSGSTIGAGDDCMQNPGAEQIVEVVIPYAGEWTFSLCTGQTDYDAWLDLRTYCCGGDLITSSDDYCGLQPQLPCVELAAGTYYLHVEGYSVYTGSWGLVVEACTPPPCQATPDVHFYGGDAMQSQCATLCPEQVTALAIHANPEGPALNPNRRPVVVVLPGCNSEHAGCEDNDCPPALEFGYDPEGWLWENGSWYNHITGTPGCVCITLEGFLSVELASFSAVPGSNEVTVNWRTASETNNDYFEILRDGQPASRIPTLGNGAEGHAYRWVDRDVQNGTRYSYSLVSVDLYGVREELGSETVVPSLDHAVITDYALHQNYPNPFNPATDIRFDLPAAGHVELKIYNSLGQSVRTLVQGSRPAGSHVVNWDGTDDQGHTVPSGLYLCQLQAGSFSSTRKMLLMK